MFARSRGGRPAGPSPRSQFSSCRLVLEVLEGRCPPAAAPITPLTASADTGLIVPLVAQPAPVNNAAAQALLTPATALPGAPLSPQPPLIDQMVWGFPGRIVFPGTGLQVRSATEPGPMTQPPGVFLVGGSGEGQLSAPDVPAAHAAPAGAEDELTPEEMLDLLFANQLP